MGVRVKSIVLIVVAACGGTAPPPPVVPLVVTPPVLALELPGAEPQLVLRVDPALHTPERIITTNDYTQTSAIITGALPPRTLTSEMPRIRTVQRLEATSTTAGDTIVTATIEDIRADGALPAARQDRVVRDLQKLVGSTCSWHQTASGLQDRFTGSVALTNGTIPCEAFRNSAVVFPDAAVGVGAIWKLSSTYIQGKVTFHRDATFQLLALADDVATLDISVLMFARPQLIDREPYASTDLDGATMWSHGIIKVPLHRLGFTGTSQGSSELAYILTRRGKGLAGGESKVRLTQQAQFSVELSLAP